MSRAGWIAVGLLADRVVTELPNRWHPVAWFGTLMGRVERRMYTDRISAGAGYAAIGVLLGGSAGRLLRNPAGATVIVCAGSELRRVASEVEAVAGASGLEAGRAAVAGLVGRDTAQLDESGIAAATIESVAENTVDAVFAPVFWAVVAGATGALAYRAVNTMDAMVGRRNERYERFGKVAARLDDAANFVPARVFALAVAAVRPRRAFRVGESIGRDAGAHPSPNAGVAETAAAAALGVELGGPLRYGETVEHRPTLGEGPRPALADINRVNALSSDTESVLLASLLLAAIIPAYRCRRTL